MWRQGDVLIQEVDAVPTDAARREDLVLAEGQATGHRHEIKDPKSAELFAKEGTLYLKVRKTAEVVHPEHGAIVLRPASYRVWQQREFVERGTDRTVID